MYKGYVKVDKDFNSIFKDLREENGMNQDDPTAWNNSGRNTFVGGRNFEDYIDVDKKIQTDFCLRVRGSSMINTNILDGDIVFIKNQSDVDDGEIAAVLINEEATLKRVYKIGDIVQLRAENPSFKPIILNGNTSVLILGKATYKLSKVL